MFKLTKDRRINPNRMLCIKKAASHARVIDANPLLQSKTSTVKHFVARRWRLAVAAFIRCIQLCCSKEPYEATTPR